MTNPISIQIKPIYLMLFLILLGIQNQLFAQVQNITITRTVNSNKSINLNYEKKLPGSYYIVLTFSDVTNCNINEYKGLINEYSGKLLKLKPIDSHQGIGYSLKFNSIMGVPDPKIDSLFQYVLPFKNGKKATIYEAEKSANRKSYSINFTSSDTVYSMRKGIVVKLINDYEENTSVGKQYTNKINSIIVEHEDGTYAEYKGFKKNSFKVKLGQTVYPQTELGTVELFNKQENNYKLDFAIYYLTNKDFKTEKETLKNRTNWYTFLGPYFITSEGVIAVESKKDYTSLFNEASLLKELTRSEKKKYAKDPSQFR